MALIRRGIHRLGYAWVAVKDSRLLKTREFYTHEMGLLAADAGRIWMQKNKGFAPPPRQAEWISC